MHDEKKEVIKMLLMINSVLNNTSVTFVDGSYGYLPINRASPYLITLHEELLKEFPYLFNDCFKIKSQFDITISKELYANHQNKTSNENDLDKVIIILHPHLNSIISPTISTTNPTKLSNTLSRKYPTIYQTKLQIHQL